jgi:NAD(P)-dependent dehydrogenase (short-subunit alcohol dehydrogenase family)
MAISWPPWSRRQIADVITFLASRGARFVTGQIVAVSGGKTAA